MKLTGAQIIIECLKEQGVDTVFGYPGGAILNVYDELYKHSDEIKHVLTSHEQGASHAADGYARSTGRVGVCFATSGPGATNLVTGIATAHMDSVPMVAITCNVGVSLLGKDSFQEVDIAGITTPITKHNFIVKDVEKLADTIRYAFDIARNGRPGPVLVDVTKDVTANQTEYAPEKIDTVRKPVTEIEGDLDYALELLNEAERPFIFAGGGVVISEAYEELKEFAEKLDAPVCDSLMGKGSFDNASERYTGMLGMHGTKTSNLGVSECDLLVALGVRFSDRVAGDTKNFAKNIKVIHVDIDPAEINKNVKVDAGLSADVKNVLKYFNEKLSKKEHTDWMAHISDMKREYPMCCEESELTGPYIVSKISDDAPEDTIIVTEVGQHQMWAAQYYKFKGPRTFLSSGGLGTMGYGLGAAIGAAVANPGRRVINIAGDGCFRMNMNELITASRNKLPLIEVIVNNSVLGMVHQWQQLFYGNRYSSTVFDDGCDYVKLAEALGCTGFRVQTQEQFDRVIKKALEMNTPVVIDCVIGSDDNVWPMVAPGHPLTDIMTRESVS